ncbi:MAG: choice-of-anchor L domain-containing protein [Nannocystis sp.]|nr:choice-of-anchor L domain-containing protein [Nannocystis sp.]MBA3544900.1 choice-of-anchor L domain-containing protein [Nannocystis sp.]
MVIAIRPWVLGVSCMLGAACGDSGAGGSETEPGSETGTPQTGVPASEGPTSDSASPTSDATTAASGATASAGETSPATDGAGSTGDASAATSESDGTGTGGLETDGTTGSSDSGDTDDSGDDTEPVERTCPLALAHLPCDADSDDPLHAIGLNCTSLGGEYVASQNAVAVQKLEWQAVGVIAGKRPWQVARAYGSFIDPDTQQPLWSPREGEKLLMMSSGLLPAPDGAGAVVIAGDAVYNDVGGAPWDDDVMPPLMSQKPGSPEPMGFKNCDGLGDCSNTLQAQWALGDGDPNDRMWFNFQVTAPALADGAVADANGYSFDFAFFSAEFPEWVDTPYNDIFVVWQTSIEYTGNITFIKGQPLTVTALWPIDYQGECALFDAKCVGKDPRLEGTGYRNGGGATSWYTASGGVTPGETFRLAFAIFDMGDSTYDTTAILDDWRWDCEGCVPTEVDSCGVRPS